VDPSSRGLEASEISLAFRIGGDREAFRVGGGTGGSGATTTSTILGGNFVVDSGMCGGGIGMGIGTAMEGIISGC
jgi:hypothetical protein